MADLSPVELLHFPRFIAEFAAIREASALSWTEVWGLARAAANNPATRSIMNTVPSNPDPPSLHGRSSQLPTNGSGLVGTVTEGGTYAGT